MFYVPKFTWNDCTHVILKPHEERREVLSQSITHVLGSTKPAVGVRIILNNLIGQSLFIFNRNNWYRRLRVFSVNFILIIILWILISNGQYERSQSYSDCIIIGVNGAFTYINFLACNDALKVSHDGTFWKSCNFTTLPATDQISYDMS